MNEEATANIVLRKVRQAYLQMEAADEALRESNSHVLGLFATPFVSDILAKIEDFQLLMMRTRSAIQIDNMNRGNQ